MLVPARLLLLVATASAMIATTPMTANSGVQRRASTIISPQTSARTRQVVRPQLFQVHPCNTHEEVRPSVAEWFSPSATRLTPNRVISVGVVVNVLLSGFKLLVGIASGSSSLIADAGHSCGDLLSDGFCYAAESVPAWERVCTLGISAMLGATGVAMIAAAGRSLFATLGAGYTATACRALDAAALLVAVVSVVSKEALFHLTMAVGLRHSKSTLVANAHHHRSDAMSSIVAVLGIGGSIVGFGCIDSLAALTVGGMVLKMGVETAMEASAVPA